MFINKLRDNSIPNSSEMSSYINLFLKTEITCIPYILNNYISSFYNNAIFNGATWVFVVWCVFHVIFDKLIDAFLRKLRYREFVRLRLKDCLWYLGFYGTALMYCRATLAQNEVELFNFKKMHLPSGSSLPAQMVLGYTLISTFYIHSSLWEGLTKVSLINMFSYLFLFAFIVSSYILRIVEISFTLTALIGIAQVAVEFTRCCFMSSNQDTLLSKFILGLLYFTTFAIYVAIYILVIPLTFIVPLGFKILSDYPNILLLFLFFNLVLWLITEIYQSMVFKFVDHWLYHEGDSKDESLHKCSNGYLECSLFEPRDDDSYNLQLLREEIKSRETKMMSMRKPKNKGMLIQTLKCMVALKKKLGERRLSESSDSDDSEKSEDSDLRPSENTDEDTGELLSDQDEESDDEESEALESVIETKNVIKDDENENEAVVPDESKLDDIKETENENIDLSVPDNCNDNDRSSTNIKPIEEPNVPINNEVEIHNNQHLVVGDEVNGASVGKIDAVVPLEDDISAPQIVDKDTGLNDKEVVVEATDVSSAKKVKEANETGNTE